MKKSVTNCIRIERWYIREFFAEVIGTFILVVSILLLFEGFYFYELFIILQSYITLSYTCVHCNTSCALMHNVILIII